MNTVNDIIERARNDEVFIKVLRLAPETHFYSVQNPYVFVSFNFEITVEVGKSETLPLEQKIIIVMLRKP